MTNPTAPSPAPPEWLANIANHVAGHIEPIDEFAAVSCHFADTGEGWELTLFLQADEQIGGPHDGSRLYRRFSFDLVGACDALDYVERFYWQTLPIDDGDELGPHIAIIGQSGRESVWIRVLSEPGERFDPLD